MLSYFWIDGPVAVACFPLTFGPIRSILQKSCGIRGGTMVGEGMAHGCHPTMIMRSHFAR